MAKTKGPLFSNTAWGTIRRALTFSRRTSGQQVRYQRAQVDYENPARATQREKFSLGLVLWRALPTNEKDYWNEIEMKGYADV